MLKQRIITAIVLALTFIVATVVLNSFLYSLFISAVVLVACWEWCGLIGLTDVKPKFTFLATFVLMLVALHLYLGVLPQAETISSSRAAIVLGFGVLFWSLIFLILKGYPNNTNAWNDKSRIASMALLALLPTWTGVVLLKFMAPMGYLVLALVVMVAAADIGAYFAGKAFGKNKLAPQLSPNKTWEGVWGGLLLSFNVGLLFIWLLNVYRDELDVMQIAVLVLLSLAVTLFDVLGDLLESMLKRNQNLKDSGSILPGHGGILDRVDGLLAVTPIFAVTLLIIE